MHAHDGRWQRLGLLGLLWILELAYLVSPIDLLPDFLPGVGLLDDLFGLMLSFVVTGLTVWRVLPGAPVAIGGPTPDRRIPSRDVYEPLSRDDLEAL